MPLRAGDHAIVTFVNGLEERIEALERAVGKGAKSKSAAPATPAPAEDVKAKDEPKPEAKDTSKGSR